MFTRTRKTTKPKGARAGRVTVTTQAGPSVYDRTYNDTPAGRLEAARDKVNDEAYLVGHRMQYWSKDGRAKTPCYTARCSVCGGTVKVTAGRASTRDPGYGSTRPSIVRSGRITSCPGRPKRGGRR